MAQPVKAPPNPFRTLMPDGTPCTRRFSSAAAVLEVFKTCQQQDDSGDAPRRARIRRMYDLFRPFDPAKLEAAGNKTGANVNLGGLAGQVDARAGRVNDMALDTTNLIELRSVEEALAGPDADKIGSVTAEEFSTVLREGRSFLPAVAMMVREAELYGLGPVTWRDATDFQLVALERGQVKFPSDAPALSVDNELIFVETPLPAAYLVGLLDYPDAAAAAGWNLSAVRQLLTDIFLSRESPESQAGNSTETSVEEARLALARQNRAYETRQFEKVTVINAFVREVAAPQKVSHYMVPAKGTPVEFLFLRPQAYDSMDQCVMWLPYSVTERHARGLRGVASKLMPFEDLRNRNFCRLMDAVASAASVRLEGPTVGESLKNTIVEQGRYTLFTGGVKPVSARVDPDFQQLAAVNEMISRTATNNALGASGVSAVAERVYAGADRKTKEQVQLEASAGAKAEQALFVLRSTVMDALFRECFRRFLALVLDQPPETQARYPGVTEFLRRCERRGVTKKHLQQIPELFTVYMCRDLVNGGAEVKAGILANVLELGGNLDEMGRVHATHDYIRARAGAAAALRYRPVIGRDQMPTDAASHAVIENNDMMEGSATLVGYDQLHWSHVPVHAQLLTQIKDAVESGNVPDPETMFKTFQLVSEHVQTHIEAGGRQIGKEQEAKQALASLRSLRPVAQALTMMVQTAERQREAQAQAQAAEQQKLRDAADQTKAAVQMHEADNQAAVQMYKVDKMHEARMAAETSNAQIGAFRARTQAEIQRLSARYRSLVAASRSVGQTTPSTDALGGGGEMGVGLESPGAM